MRGKGCWMQNAAMHNKARARAHYVAPNEDIWPVVCVQCAHEKLIKLKWIGRERLGKIKERLPEHEGAALLECAAFLIFFAKHAYRAVATFACGYVWVSRFPFYGP